MGLPNSSTRYLPLGSASGGPYRRAAVNAGAVSKSSRPRFIPTFAVWLLVVNKVAKPDGCGSISGTG
jgi:hypothetical protein